MPSRRPPRSRRAALLLVPLLLGGLAGCSDPATGAGTGVAADGTALTVSDGYVPDGAAVSPFADVPAITRLEPGPARGPAGRRPRRGGRRRRPVRDQRLAERGLPAVAARRRGRPVRQRRGGLGLRAAAGGVRARDRAGRRHRAHRRHELDAAARRRPWAVPDLRQRALALRAGHRPPAPRARRRSPTPAPADAEAYVRDTPASLPWPRAGADRGGRALPGRRRPRRPPARGHRLRRGARRRQRAGEPRGQRLRRRRPRPRPAGAPPATRSPAGSSPTGCRAGSSC